MELTAEEFTKIRKAYKFITGMPLYCLLEDTPEEIGKSVFYNGLNEISRKLKFSTEFLSEIRSMDDEDERETLYVPVQNSIVLLNQVYKDLINLELEILEGVIMNHKTPNCDDRRYITTQYEEDFDYYMLRKMYHTVHEIMEIDVKGENTRKIISSCQSIYDIVRPNYKFI